MLSLRHLLALLLATGLVATTALACDDGGGDDSETDTTVADTAVADTAGDTAEEDTGDDADQTDADDDADQTDADDLADASDQDQSDAEVWTDPAVFSVVFADTELREVIYLVDASTISIPQVKLRAESIGRQPIVGQTVAVAAGARTRIDPSESVTDEQGLTGLVTLTLGDDMSQAVAHHMLTPYIVPNEPDTIRNTITVDAYGATVELAPPTDGEGNALAPVADGGASTWTLTIALARADAADLEPLPGDLEVGFEFVTNQGTPALAFADDPSATEMRWPVDPSDPNLAVDLVSTATEPGQARFYLRLYQRDGSRGQRLETIDVVAAP